MKELETHLCFGGTLTVYEHESAVLGCTMKFSVFLPPQARDGDVTLLTYLSGLTCTYDNFTTKAGAYGFAAAHGIAILAPDTSPRGDDVPDDEAYDFGKGAGFYINATRGVWAQHFKMEDYIVKELNALVCKEFSVLDGKQGITGHSMGGHGALTLGLKYPETFTSISAFAPIVAPSQVPWGEKAFTGYLGDDKEEWLKHDATALMQVAGKRTDAPEILIDQGGGDDFLDEQLKPHLFADACSSAGQKLTLRIHNGYDHSYYFIQSYIEDHIIHHTNILTEKS
ncbi:MAG: S-formylglutathione hydrolase [Alphaproteobacteria bacterium]|nr:S-formylglutathione hydrolase [Alphaproteobacteria bacterium]